MVSLQQRLKHIFMDKADIEKAAAAKQHAEMVGDTRTFLNEAAGEMLKSLVDIKDNLAARDDPATSPEDLDKLRLPTFMWSLPIDARELTDADRQGLKDEFKALQDAATAYNVRLIVRGINGVEPLLSYMDPNEPKNPLQIEVRTSQPSNPNQTINYQRNKGMGM